jgi:hypothetical protein
MKSFKQALIQLKSDLKNSLLLGAGGTVFIYSVRNIPYLSAFFLALGVLILQELACKLAAAHTWHRDLDFLKKNLVAYIGTSLVLLPTFVLAGSAMGILQSPQGLALTMPLALILFMLSVYFYFVLSHALRLHVNKKISLAKAIDILGISSLRRFRMYFVLSFYLGLLLMLSGMTWGAGFIISLPLLFYTDHYAYLELSRGEDFIARVRQ